MADKEKIIRYYKGTEGAETAVRLVDLAEQVMRSQKVKLAGFLDQFGQEIAETVAASYDGLRVEFNGGYQGAERQRAALIHTDFMGTPAFDICVVRAEWNDSYYRLSHRDILGAVLGLGIERDRIGDILIAAGNARILTDGAMAEFLLANCTKIGPAAVTMHEDQIENIVPKEERCKEIRATVASLRVDSIAAAGFGFSRSRAASDIAADKLKLNWQSVKGASQLVKEGDILSMRGRGRLEVTEIRGLTKKGRTSVVLHKFI